MKIRDQASFYSLFLRINEQTGEKRSTVDTQKNANCLKMSTKCNKYVVNQRTFNIIRVFFLQNNNCPFLRQGIRIYVVHSFL